MLGNLAAAQFDLERAIAELAHSGVAIGAAQSQLAKVGKLMRAVGNADAATLTTMQADISGLISEASAIVQQGRDAANRTDVGETLAAVNARTRATVERISDALFERKVFDPYLQFASEEEERAYRKREAEREAYIKRELAKGTPEGTLNATVAAREQIEDAGAHGADRSPEYRRLLDEAKSAEASLGSAMSHDGVAKEPSGPAPASKEEKGGLDDILAALRDAGVKTTEVASANPAHGLTAGKLAAGSRQV